MDEPKTRDILIGAVILLAGFFWLSPDLALIMVLISASTLFTQYVIPAIRSGINLGINLGNAFILLCGATIIFVVVYAVFYEGRGL